MANGGLNSWLMRSQVQSLFSRDICSVPTHSEKGRKNNLYHASKTGLDKHSIVTALKLIVEFIEAIVLVSQMTGQ